MVRRHLRDAIRSPFVRGASAALAFTVLTLLIVPVRYATNDDIGFLWALNGGDGFAPENFALFNGHFLNTALYHLYARFPGIPWWGIAIYVALTSATTLLFAFLFRIGKRSFSVLPVVVFFLLVCHVHAGITSATLLLVSAVLLWIHRLAIEDFTAASGRWAPAAALSACLAIGLLMRWQAALAFLVFGLTSCVAARPGNRARIVAILLAACAVLAVDRVVFAIATSPDQARFLQDNALRARFHDTPAGAFRTGVTEQALTRAGWTHDDYSFFRAWNLYDDSLFTPTRLRNFLEVNSEQAANGYLSPVIDNTLKAKKNLLLFALALLTLILATPGRVGPATLRAHVTPWLLPVACTAALFFFLYHRFVERVYLPLLILFLAATLASLARSAGGLSSGFARPRWIVITARAVFILQLAAVTIVMARFVPTLYSDERLARFTGACLEAIPGDITSVALLDPATGLGSERGSPLRERLATRGPAIIPDGVWNGSPRLNAMFAARVNGGGRAFLRASPRDSTLVWALWESPVARQDIFAAWEGYYRRNLGETVTFKMIHACPDPRGGRLGFHRMVRTP